ncbi:MAG: dihydroxy-acid dehydratase [Acidimicrobiia bacterium]
MTALDLGGTVQRMMLRAAGTSTAAGDDRPVVGVANSWSELGPCNVGLRAVADAVKRGIARAGGTPLEFSTISPQEAFVAPSSLYLRNLMALEVEEMVRASPFDAVVFLGGCDKTLPAQLMGVLSAGIPALGLAAGPRAVGQWRGRPVTVDDIWDLLDERRAGRLGDQEWDEVERQLAPGVGTCNVMGTATTMAVATEVLGMSLPGTALLPATSAARLDAAERTGERVVELARAGTPPSEFVTLESLENAYRVVAALGGSTNAVIHLEAVAGRAGTGIGVDRFGEWSRTTPLVGDVKPSGTHLLADLAEAGGVPGVMSVLAPLLHLDRLSGTGRPWRDELAGVRARTGGAIRPLEDPVWPTGGLVALRGSLAPDGAIIKRSAADPRLWRHTGPAVVFDGLADLRARIDDPDLDVDAGSVIVLRGVGPVGGPGMPEVGQLPIPTRLLQAGVTDMVRISDARMSGTGHGAIVLHVAPEAAAGGPLALVRDGDPIALDVEAGTLDLQVEPDELARRAAALPVPPEGAGPQGGYARLHADHVVQADLGCDLDFLRAPR